MIPLVSDKYRYIYFFNPKSACSTYRHLFLDLHRDELPADQRESASIHDARVLFAPRSGIDFRNYFRFTIVRNPFARIVSSYLDKCFEINAPPAERYRVPEHHQRLIFQPIFSFLQRTPDFDRGFSFQEFLQYLQFAADKQLKPDIHFRAQIPVGTRIDGYYRIEDPIEELMAIFHHVFSSDYYRLNLESRIRHHSGRKVNASLGEGSDKTYREKDLAGAPFDVLNRLRDEGFRFHYSSFYDESSRQLVASIFERELAYYEYSFPY